MTGFWQQLSQTKRMFIAFGVFMVLVTVMSILFQANFFTSARLKHLAEFEIPTQLERLALEVRLQLEPGIQTSRMLANDADFHARLTGAASEEERLALVESRMLNIQEGFDANSLFLAARLPDAIRLYHYGLGQLQVHSMHANDPAHAWYFDFINQEQHYSIHLDTSTFTGNKLQVFVNYRGEQDDAGGAPLQVGGVALDAEVLTGLVNSFRLGDNGYASLVSADGDILSSPDRSILASLHGSTLLASLLDNESGEVFERNHNGMDYILSSIWLDSLQLWLVFEVPRQELTAPITRQMWAAQAIGMGLMLLALVLIYPVARSLTRPLRDVQFQLGNITRDLDLGKRISVADRAELGDLAQQVNLLLERVQQAILEIYRSAGLLNDSAGRLAHTAGLTRTSEQTSETRHSMAAAIEQMSSSVAEITSTMEELSASSTQIADHSQSVVDVANLTLDSSKKGAQAMQELEQHMAGIHSDYEHSLQDILELGNQSKAISKVMDLINSVADQTKLIAFNAALEASSAGEAGKRFSVVAGEIRRLADSVTESTLSIEERIQAIQSSISRLIITSEKAVNSVQSGMDVSAATALELNSLVDAASRTSSAAQQISLSTRQQKTASSQVVIALRDIANASSNNAKSVRDITDISQELLSMADALNLLVQEFRVASPEAGQAPHAATGQ